MGRWEVAEYGHGSGPVVHSAKAVTITEQVTPVSAQVLCPSRKLSHCPGRPATTMQLFWRKQVSRTCSP